MATWDPVEGETPIDSSHLKDKSIKTREQLNIAEAQNILKPIVKYLGGKPSIRNLPPLIRIGFKSFTRKCSAMFGNTQASYAKKI
jgi:hypothetical protein